MPSPAPRHLCTTRSPDTVPGRVDTGQPVPSVALFSFFFFTQISPLDVRKVPGLFAHAPGARVSLSFRAAFQVRYSHMPTCLSLAHMALKPCTLRDRFAVDTVPIRFHLTAPPAAPAACYRLSLLIFFPSLKRNSAGLLLCTSLCETHTPSNNNICQWRSFQSGCEARDTLQMPLFTTSTFVFCFFLFFFILPHSRARQLRPKRVRSDNRHSLSLSLGRSTLMQPER